MCGLVGVIGTIDKVDNKIFRDLLRVDVLRGPHSTGICSRTRMEEPVVLKKALLPDELFSIKKADALFNEFNRNDILMGHNRWATMGKVNNTNAHPFEMDKIIGAHNGTLRKQHLLPDSTKFQVDSENIFHSFEKIGVKETVKKLDGAFALTWFDKTTNVFNFTRNDERSLYYCFSAKGKTFYYASEDWMLEGILARHRVEHQGIIEFDPLYHYQLVIPDQGQPFHKKSFTMQALEEYEPPKQTNHWNQSRCRNTSGTSGTHTTGNVMDLTKRLHSKTGTDGGTSDGQAYEVGDNVFFKILSDPPGAKYLVGRDVSNIERKIHIFVPRGAVLRKKMLASDVSEWWVGVVNGYEKTGAIIVQANSVTDYDSFQEANGWDEGDAEDAEAYNAEDVALSNNDPQWERHVELIAAVGRCGWCDETLDPTDDNHIENAHTIICPHCKALPEVQDFISLQITENLF